MQVPRQADSQDAFFIPFPSLLFSSLSFPSLLFPSLPFPSLHFPPLPFPQGAPVLLGSGDGISGEEAGGQPRFPGDWLIWLPSKTGGPKGPGRVIALLSMGIPCPALLPEAFSNQVFLIPFWVLGTSLLLAQEQLRQEHARGLALQAHQKSQGVLDSSRTLVLVQKICVWRLC